MRSANRWPIRSSASAQRIITTFIWNRQWTQLASRCGKIKPGSVPDTAASSALCAGPGALAFDGCSVAVKLDVHKQQVFPAVSADGARLVAPLVSGTLGISALCRL